MPETNPNAPPSSAPGGAGQHLGTPAEEDTSNGVVGYCDGYRDGAVHGWAWRPNRPHEGVEIELWADDVLVGRASADIERGDLAANGIGDGRYGWRIPLALDSGRDAPVRVEARVSGGSILRNGIFELTLDPAQARPGEALGHEPAPSQPTPPAPNLPAGIIGAVDGIDDGTLIGWVWQPDRPEEHVQVELWIDGTKVGATVAKELRADLLGAGLGHGRYGWRLPVTLDPTRSTSRIEVRASGGDLLANGAFDLAPISCLTDERKQQPDDDVEGACDGYRDGALHGWAWRPARPDQYVDVELWIDGVLKSGTEASMFRPDLRANGIGHGRHAWRIPVIFDAPRGAPLAVEVRAKGGSPLSNGVFSYWDDLPLEDPANEDLRPFVASVFEGAPRPALPAASPSAPVVNILLHCPEGSPPGPFEAREYDDYLGTMNAFRPVLEKLGRVTTIDSVEDADRIHDERLRNGESTILLSFAQPHRTLEGLRCPVVPVFAWAFPTLPAKVVGTERRADWRTTLREAGRAIVFSTFARDAVLSAMGPDFPVAAIPPPLFDRVATLPSAAASAAEIGVDGVVFDSRNYEFSADATVLPIPVAAPEALSADNRRTVKLSGVVFTAFLDFADGRKNWRDIVRAFRAAHQHNKDATLVIKLSERCAQWWEELSRLLVRNSPFDCRFVAIRGDMTDQERQALIDATHWIVSGANAEGLSLPLMEYMSAGRPAIAPAHTALADYISTENSLVVASDEESWVWPQQAAEGEGFSWTLHPDAVTPTTRHRLSWSGLRDAVGEAYRLSTVDQARYAAMAAASRESMRRFCRDEVVVPRLDGFLGLNQEHSEAPRNPSRLVAESGRA